jgi:hypothetical protein
MPNSPSGSIPGEQKSHPILDGRRAAQTRRYALASPTLQLKAEALETEPLETEALESGEI